MRGHYDITLGGLIAICGVMIYVGWIASAGYFKIAERWDDANRLQHLETKYVPALKSYAGCQAKRAITAENELVMSQVGVDTVQSDLPDCPGVPKAPPPVPKK